MRRLRKIFDNPLIQKDGLSRMRSWRAPAVIALYLGMLGLFAYLLFAVQLGSGRRVWGYAQVGTGVFTGLAMVQLALVCLFTPAVASGAVSGERERQTLDVLVVSGVTSLGIVWGKLMASVAFILLLIASALPLFATVFLFGGVDGQQFVVMQLLTVTTALAIGAVAVLLSVISRRTLLATVLAYGFTFAGTIGTWIVGSILTQIASSAAYRAGATGPPDPHPLLLVNPIQAMITVLQSPNGGRVPLGRTVAVLFGGPPTGAGPMVEPWQATVVAQLALVALCITGAVLLLRGRRPLTLPWRRAEEPEETGHEPEAPVAVEPGRAV